MKLIVIPTYNERKNLAELLALIYRQVEDFHVLIVDDNSPDGTGELVRELIQSHYSDKLFLLARSGKLGLGTAYIAGFKWALERDYQYIFEMDADFSHNPKYLKQILIAAENCDLVLGSRYVPGGGVTNWNVIRRMISYGGSLYSRLILGLPFKDLTGGYKCFRREILANIDLDDVRSNGYSFQIELTYRAYLKSFTIREVPIIFEERAAGKSKMSRKIFIEAIWMVLKLRAAKNHLKASGPKSIFCPKKMLTHP
ncbi:dolichol-phosphate mannosyltransferase [Sporomusaceae bacterium BoRhaA]|uniref:polyprenol monophosphomannose synthase n=1 Tax=Pelorhabdus rhamnosifermentans TaxID=2772457 RepID=UPI001C06356E|nr:polyprenol monophosphomannose synthase [Pelorhabdus rhamnosifermentans]MBU2699357.1 dolichol-phosphate mannosyltransferase [Pelorhabdus rhamnosifermentans]